MAKRKQGTHSAHIASRVVPGAILGLLVSGGFVLSYAHTPLAHMWGMLVIALATMGGILAGGLVFVIEGEDEEGESRTVVIDPDVFQTRYPLPPDPWEEDSTGGVPSGPYPRPPDPWEEHSTGHAPSVPWTEDNSYPWTEDNSRPLTCQEPAPKDTGPEENEI